MKTYPLNLTTTDVLDRGRDEVFITLYLPTEYWRVVAASNARHKTVLPTMLILTDYILLNREHELSRPES